MKFIIFDGRLHDSCNLMPRKPHRLGNLSVAGPPIVTKCLKYSSTHVCGVTLDHFGPQNPTALIFHFCTLRRISGPFSPVMLEKSLNRAQCGNPRSSIGRTVCPETLRSLA